ncbi:MAG: ferritin-like domain-containing protein [Bdellovibrionales bacterium]
MSAPLINTLSRRDLVLAASKLSGAVALFSTTGMAHVALAADPGKLEPAKDVEILNVALSLEHQAIAAYQISADSGLLKQQALNLCLLFQSHHKTHREALVDTVKKLGGSPASAQQTAEYAKSLDTGSLKSQTDLLELALKLELNSANAFIGLIPSLGDRDAARLCGRLVADQAMHWTALLSFLGKPLPANGLTFGA